MPVLSPHRSTTSSGLSGSYRSTFGSSLESRSYGGGGYGLVSPRISSYASERFSTRSTYTESSGRSYYSSSSRAGSITDDGYSTSTSSRRESSTLLDSPVRRSASDLVTSPSSSSSRASVSDSIADLRSKYSASNYVPAVLRNRSSRHRTSDDLIGLPPSSIKVTPDSKNLNNASSPHSTNNTNSAVDTTDVDNMRQHDDDNGNRPNASPQPGNGSGGGVSVLEMTKKFEKRCGTTSTTTTSSAVTAGASTTTAAATQTRRTTTRTPTPVTTSALTVVSLSKHADTAAPKRTHRNVLVPTTSPTKTKPVINGRHANHINDFANFIPLDSNAHNGDVGKITTNVENGDCNGTASKTCKKSANKDVNSTSPRLNRSPIATTANGGALGGSSSNRNSLERDGSHSRTMGGANMYETPSVSQLANHSAYDRSSPVKIMGLNGLKNIGNTCFMNSVIQCLSNTRPLLEYVKKEGYSSDINTTLSSMKGALIKAFAQVIKELWSEESTDRVVNTVSLKSQIQRFAPRFMGYSQQDAQEFLRYLLEGLHEDVNRVTSKPMPIHTEIDEKLSDNEKASESWQRYLRRDNSKIVDLFVGQFKSTLKCTHCGHCSVTFDPFWDLSLPIPQKTGAIRLSQCLDSFTREETLDGDEKPTCSKCKERRKCTKSFTIHKFPKILVIHLKRFSPTERFRGKLSVTVDFPLEGLDMTNYASESNVQCRYNLYAVSNHSGTTYSGHYTAYCRHPYSTTWHEYNDSRVSSISSKSVVSGEAYVLFYELDGKISAHL